MRALFTFAGGAGHAEPLVPVARAARDAGHTVAFAGRASVVADLQARGYTVFADPADEADPAPGTERAIAPLLALSAAREDRVLRDAFAGAVARGRAHRVLTLCRDWSPDAVVCDEVDFGAMVAAERAEVPHATVTVTAAGSFVRAEVVADLVDALRAEYGLAGDPSLEMPARHLVLSPCPPSFRDPAFPLPPTACAIRPAPIEPARRAAGAGWLSEPSVAPTVLFTLGTVFNLESGDLFGRVLAGLGGLGINVIATVGRTLDPRRFEPQPANVRLAAHIPQAAVLPYCDLVVSHGGSGTVVGTLTAGLPSVVLPMGADQPYNAARCEALGVGRRLDALRATPEEVGQAVVAVLAEPGYRAAAERIRDEIAGLPGPAHAVGLLERLVATAGR